MHKAFIILKVILKAAAIASIAAACAQGPLLISKSLWVAGRWASSEAKAFRSLPEPNPPPFEPPIADRTGPVLAPR